LASRDIAMRLFFPCHRYYLLSKISGRMADKNLTLRSARLFVGSIPSTDVAKAVFTIFCLLKTLPRLKVNRIAPRWGWSSVAFSTYAF
jgi:hypothetical protein